MQLMKSRAGKATVQQHMCFSRHNEEDGQPWEQKAKSKQVVNPDRLTRGIAREEYKDMKQDNNKETDQSEEESDDSEGVTTDPYDGSNSKLTRD